MDISESKKLLYKSNPLVDRTESYFMSVNTKLTAVVCGFFVKKEEKFLKILRKVGKCLATAPNTLHVKKEVAIAIFL